MSKRVTEDEVEAVLADCRQGEPCYAHERKLTALIFLLCADRRDLEKALSDTHRMCSDLQVQLQRYARDLPGDVKKLLAEAQRKWASDLLASLPVAPFDHDYATMWRGLRDMLRVEAEGNPE